MSEPRMTGGSSHGSAVAMAAGLAGFTVGSDTGGSVRWPAALCGVVGYKASSSHWPCDGVFPLSPELDSIGLFTRSAHDAALVQCRAGWARAAPTAWHRHLDTGRADAALHGPARRARCCVALKPRWRACAPPAPAS